MAKKPLIWKDPAIQTLFEKIEETVETHLDAIEVNIENIDDVKLRFAALGALKLRGRLFRTLEGAISQMSREEFADAFSETRVMMDYSYRVWEGLFRRDDLEQLLESGISDPRQLWQTLALDPGKDGPDE